MANLLTKIWDFRGFDSSILLISRGGILMSIGNFPKSLGQAILARIILVGRLCELPSGLFAVTIAGWVGVKRTRGLARATFTAEPMFRDANTRACNQSPTCVYTCVCIYIYICFLCYMCSCLLDVTVYDQSPT